MKAKIIKNALVASALIFSSTLSAKECVNLDKVNVKWTSFKTLEKIGVSGTFKKVQLSSKENSSSLKEALESAKVKINISDIDANAAIKTNNILKYFVTNLETKNIDAKIKNVYDKSLEIELYLNGKKQIIPMSFTNKNNTIMAKGVIDALDFNLSPALKILNTEVAGHLNKGWYDIPIYFNLAYLKECK